LAKISCKNLDALNAEIQQKSEGGSFHIHPVVSFHYLMKLRRRKSRYRVLVKSKPNCFRRIFYKTRPILMKFGNSFWNKFATVTYLFCISAE